MEGFISGEQSPRNGGVEENHEEERHPGEEESIGCVQEEGEACTKAVVLG